MKKWPRLGFKEINRLTLYQGAILMGAIDEAFGETLSMTDSEYEAYFGQPAESQLLRQMLGG